MSQKRFRKGGTKAQEQNTEFTARHRNLLKDCETTIRKGVKHFLAVGQALSTIREKRLYKVKGYDTFEAYCRKEWRITRQYANRLILTFRVEQELETTVSKPVLENPNQAKRFSELDPDAQAAVKQSIANGASFDDAIGQVTKKPSDIMKARQYANKLCQLLDQTEDKAAMVEAINDLVADIMEYIRLKKEQEERLKQDLAFDKAA
jgi:hypothetical protein